MKLSLLKIGCGLLTVSAWGYYANSACAQCACAAQSVQMGGMLIETNPEADAESLLIENDDPLKIINLTVVVHDKAIVKINGEPTFTKGVSRPYIVRGLKEGKSYAFEVVGTFTNEHGAVYEAKETVNIKAGDSKQVVLHLRRVKRPPQPPVPVLPVPVAAPASGAK